MMLHTSHINEQFISLNIKYNLSNYYQHLGNGKVKISFTFVICLNLNCPRIIAPDYIFRIVHECECKPS